MKKDKITKFLIITAIVGTAAAALIIFWNHNKQYFMRDTTFDDIINKIKQDQIDNHTIPNTISVIGPNSPSFQEDEVRTYISSIGDRDEENAETDSKPEDLVIAEEALYSDDYIALNVQGYAEGEEGNSILITLYNRTSKAVIVELADIGVNKDAIDSWLYTVLPEDESRNARIPIGISSPDEDDIIVKLKITPVGESEYETEEILLK